ncbi:MAG: MBL fold metallo-hydrolase [Thermofilum sp.]|nr:MBL fold metallo-hydrolase [Thermofilum sp.]
MTRTDLRIMPVADESLGVRSMALYAEIADLRILFDASASLGPRRYGLPPHPEEFRALWKTRVRILERASQADIITVSHYHRDHFTPPFASLYECTGENEYLEIYSGKIVIAKDPSKKINFSQKKRAALFLNAIKNKAKEIHLVNDAILSFGDVRIESFLAPHGEELGYVLCFVVYLEDRAVLAFLPDVQGPFSNEVLEKIVKLEPALVIVGGPPTYLSEKKVSSRAVEKGMKNLSRLFGLLDEKSEIIVSHHLLRDPDWREKLIGYGVIENKIKTYSDILGVPYTGLEAYRKLLFNNETPPSNYEEVLQKLKSEHVKCDKLFQVLE